MGERRDNHELVRLNREFAKWVEAERSGSDLTAGTWVACFAEEQRSGKRAGGPTTSDSFD